MKMIKANRLISIAMMTMTMLAFLSGCVESDSRLYWKNWNWQGNLKSDSIAVENNSDADGVIGNYFDVRILVSADSDEKLKKVWSYLDEASVLSKDWNMLHRNGLRCGVGQFSDWPIIKEQLEIASTKVKSEFQIALNTFSSMKILNDDMRKQRTLFYYDQSGKVRGRDFGPSTMQLSIANAGKMPGGRVRLVFVPKIYQQTGNWEQLQGKEKQQSFIEKELENFSIVVDLGPNEFAIIGPSKQEMPDSLVGAQLFQDQNQGQTKNYFILLSSVKLKVDRK